MDWNRRLVAVIKTGDVGSGKASEDRKVIPADLIAFVKLSHEWQGAQPADFAEALNGGTPTLGEFWKLVAYVGAAQLTDVTIGAYENESDALTATLQLTGWLGGGDNGSGLTLTSDATFLAARERSARASRKFADAASAGPTS